MDSLVSVCLDSYGKQSVQVMRLSSWRRRKSWRRRIHNKQEKIFHLIGSLIPWSFWFSYWSSYISLAKWINNNPINICILILIRRVLSFMHSKDISQWMLFSVRVRWDSLRLMSACIWSMDIFQTLLLFSDFLVVWMNSLVMLFAINTWTGRKIFVSRCNTAPQ